LKCLVGDREEVFTGVDRRADDVIPDPSMNGDPAGEGAGFGVAEAPVALAPVCTAARMNAVSSTQTIGIIRMRPELARRSVGLPPTMVLPYRRAAGAAVITA
jgi:hypothetical protein